MEEKIANPGNMLPHVWAMAFRGLIPLCPRWFFISIPYPLPHGSHGRFPQESFELGDQVERLSAHHARVSGRERATAALRQECQRSLFECSRTMCCPPLLFNHVFRLDLILGAVFRD